MKKSLFFRKLRFLAVLPLVAALLICHFPPVAARAAETVSTDICVIFDNSGSTFRDQTWCRYKYALEIFASLIDYESGTQLFIYPLCDVTLDGRVSSASTEPIVIASYADIGKIRNMYTIHPADTPFEPVIEASHFLEQESFAGQKHLVIMTDGLFDIDSSEKLGAKLLDMASKSTINIHYLGSGDAAPVTPNEDVGLYSYHMTGPADTQYLLDFVSDLYTTLFNHTKTLSTKAQQTKLHLTGSGKVIIFASGPNANAISLTDTAAISMPLLYDTGKHTYSTTAAENYPNAPVDTTLGGYISIFECSEPGEYTLNCTNSEMVNIFLQQTDGSITPSIAPTEPTNEPIQASKAWRKPVAIVLGGIALILIGVLVILLFKNRPLSSCGLYGKRIKNSKAKITDKYQIFISYRRDGGDALAGRLADRFTGLGYKVFYDVESMRSGTFNTQILDALAQCDDVLLVLPPNALDRCVNEDDWVRQELVFALKHNKNIIPIMMRGFEFPKALPAEIDKIRYMEGVTASSEYFDAVIQRIEHLLQTSKKANLQHN